jgi:hypothetical protein
MVLELMALSHRLKMGKFEQKVTKLTKKNASHEDTKARIKDG